MESRKTVRLTGEDGHYFFGYYDLNAWDKGNNYHLCHKVPFFDRLPGLEDTAVIGMIRMSDKKFIELAETKAWNFQQGSMLQWLSGKDERIIYNDRDGAKYISIILDIKTGKKKVLPLPIASVSRDGKYALSINFSRLFTFRPGYGYAGIKDPFENELHPKKDGIFLMELETGTFMLLLSLLDVAKLKPEKEMLNSKTIINHITFNPDSSRFVFLNRFPKQEGGSATGVFTADLNGENIKSFGDYGYASHYYWINPHELLFYSDFKGQGQELYIYNDSTGEQKIVDRKVFTRDTHMRGSADGRWMLSDTYPDDNRLSLLRLYDLKEKREVVLGSYYSPEPANIDIRCDLHPRWNSTSSMVSFDSIHEGRRGVYAMDLSDIV